MNQGARARVALGRLVEPGSWQVHAAVQALGAEEVVAALRAGRAIGGITEAVALGAQARSAELDPDQDLHRLAAAGGRLVLPDDEGWPDGPLRWPRPAGSTPLLAAPPLALYVRGRGSLAAVAERSVAVVGARAATAYGEHVAGELGIGLVDAGWTVVSGGAYGIDGAAHRGALSSGLAGTSTPTRTRTSTPTVAVLACGIDVAYPRGNDRLLARIGEQGLLVSEHPPGATPTRLRFLIRTSRALQHAHLIKARRWTSRGQPRTRSMCARVTRSRIWETSCNSSTS